MDKISKFLLEQIADLHDIPQAGVFNVRENGKVLVKNVDAEVNIVPKKDKEGIDIVVKKGTKNKSVHIPVLVTVGGLNDLVYNDFYIEDNSEILIVAGCGIHNSTNKQSSHNGIHSFHVGKNCKVKYVEKHFAFGNNKTEKILNPSTTIEIGDNSVFEMETMQIGGVTYSDRKTHVLINKNAKLIVRENILTTENQEARTYFNVNLVGKNSKVEVVSRAVAKNNSKQEFISEVVGNNECFGHVECDGIISDKAKVSSTPTIHANNKNAMLVHEASIGKISEEQQNKLMSLGLTKEEAEKIIIEGFLN